jgi:predicted secreted acid phosphatase
VKVQLAKHPRKPAVVLDIDETAMSSYACLDAVDFDLVGLAQCVAGHKSVAIAPALKFYKAMRARRVSVFFVTGAPEGLCDGRRGNLAAQGFTGKLAVTCRPSDDENDSLVPYKSSARKAIQKRGFTILANVGDQRSDLAGGGARKTFKLVNPIYVTP